MAVLILSSSLLRLANRAFSLTPRLLSESFSSSYAARVGITNQEGGWLSGIILKICDFSNCASSLSVIFKRIMFSEIRGVLGTSLYIKNPAVLTEWKKILNPVLKEVKIYSHIGSCLVSTPLSSLSSLVLLVFKEFAFFCILSKYFPPHHP